MSGWLRGCVVGLCWSGRVRGGSETDEVGAAVLNVGGRQGNRGVGEGMRIEGCVESRWAVRGERALLLKLGCAVRGGEGGNDTFLNAVLPTLLNVPIFPGGGKKSA